MLLLIREFIILNSNMTHIANRSLFLSFRNYFELFKCGVPESWNFLDVQVVDGRSRTASFLGVRGQSNVLELACGRVSNHTLAIFFVVAGALRTMRHYVSDIFIRCTRPFHTDC